MNFIGHHSNTQVFRGRLDELYIFPCEVTRLELLQMMDRCQDTSGNNFCNVAGVVRHCKNRDEHLYGISIEFSYIHEETATHSKTVSKMDIKDILIEHL